MHPADRIVHTRAFDKPVVEQQLEIEIPCLKHHTSSAYCITEPCGAMAGAVRPK